MGKWKYEKQITIGHDTDGKPVRTRVRANTKAELEQKTAEARQKGKEKPVNAVAFGVYSENWYTLYKSTKEAATREMYRNALRKMSSLKDVPVKDLTASDLQKIISDNAGHPSTCTKILLTMRQICALAVSEGILSSDISKCLEAPSVCVKQGRALTDEEKTAIREADLDPMQRLYVGLLYYLGLRPQEALALKPEDFNGDTVTIQRAVGYDMNRPYIKVTKTGNVRTLPVPRELKELLLRTEAKTYLIHHNGELMSKTVKSDFWVKIQRVIREKLGKETDIRPYTFRHNYCAMCYYSGLSLKKCVYLMGHHSYRMVMEVYAHLDDEKESLEVLKNISL